jgi:hypothetical protein
MKELDVGLAAKLAADASVDRRTIQKAYRGERVRGLAGSRARTALRAARLLDKEDAPSMPCGQTPR